MKFLFASLLALVLFTAPVVAQEQSCYNAEYFETVGAKWKHEFSVSVDANTAIAYGMPTEGTTIEIFDVTPEDQLPDEELVTAFFVDGCYVMLEENYSKVPRSVAEEAIRQLEEKGVVVERF